MIVFWCGVSVYIVFICIVFLSGLTRNRCSNIVLCVVRSGNLRSEVSVAFDVFFFRFRWCFDIFVFFMGLDGYGFY